MATFPADLEVSSTPTRPPALSKTPASRSKWAFYAVVALILSIYSYPTLRTTIATKNFRLPPVTAPDEGLYLSISNLHRQPDGAIVNPYYHVAVPSPVSYLKFSLGPSLFGVLNHLLDQRIWYALFLWNLLCWLALCLSAIWLLKRFLPRPSVQLIGAGVVLITLFSFEGVWRVVTALIHGSPIWISGGLPYIRPFSPQFAIPLLVFYIGIQIRALSERNISAWIFMAALQFAAFAALPYTTLMMAGTTAIGVLYFALMRPRALPWRQLLGFVFVCGVSDMAFAMRGSSGFGLSFPDNGSLIRFQPALLSPAIGKTWLLIACLVVFAALSKKLRPETKWTLVGLGITNIVLALGDAFLSERAFLMGNHIPYFYNSTLVILFVFVVSVWIPDTHRGRSLASITSLAIIVVCCGSGLILAEGNYRSNLAFNREQADLSRWLAQGQVATNDLVITRFSSSSYDDCEWIPLLSNAEVLYCRNAQLTLTAEQNRELQRFREVLYLYFDGKDHLWLETATQFEPYGLYGEISSFHTPAERSARIAALRQEMQPFFEQIEHRDPAITRLFQQFRRIWVIERRGGDRFQDQRLSSYMEIKGREDAGSLSVSMAEPK